MVDLIAATNIHIEPPVNLAHPIVVVLYGGNMSFSLEALTPILSVLHECGIGSASFYYRFMGKEREREGGLHTRIADAHCVLRHVRHRFPESPIILWGTSMGGYVAAHLFGSSEVAGAILVAPAAYDAEIVQKKLHFGTLPFKEVLRRRTHLQTTDAFHLTEAFRKPLLVVGFNDDRVVPGVPQRYVAAAGLLASLPNPSFSGDHYLFRGDALHRDRQQRVATAMRHWLEQKFPSLAHI